MQDFLSIDNVTKSFGPLRAVDGVSLRIGQGEIFSLLGPSGCGKTTLLRMLAGFQRPDSGRIFLRGREITALPPERRPVNTVFQNYALFPHLTVWENIAFGLRMAGKGKSGIREGVERMLGLVRLQEQARKRPAQLSGGQRQRVAIARALVNEPEVLLLDEPLAALDLKLRQHMLSELTALHRQIGTTFVYVTHDQGEALSLSSRIAVLNAGKVEQVAPPNLLYDSPATGFVASFIGDANFLSGVVREVSSAEASVTVEGMGDVRVRRGGGLAAGQAVRLMVRPEKIKVTPEPGAQPNEFRAEAEDTSYFGSHSRLRLKCGGHPLTAMGAAAAGSLLWISIPPEDVHVLEEDRS